MRLSCGFLVVSVVLFCLASVDSQDAPKPKNPQRGGQSQVTDPQPQSSAVQINIGTAANTNDRKDTEDEAKAKRTRFMTHGEWVISIITLAYVIVSGLIARASIKTLHAINAQVIEMRKTGEQTDKLITENIAQSDSMKLSVAEAARLASAMEAVSREIAVSAKAATSSVDILKEQMRAYLTVAIGGGVFQDRANNKRFEGKPNVINTGNTPARNVRHKCKAQILPIPLPDNFTFSLCLRMILAELPWVPTKMPC